MWAIGDRPSQRDVGDSWSYEHSYTLQERLLSDAHKLPCMQHIALRDVDSSTRVNYCGVLLDCMCRPREGWRRCWYFSGTRSFWDCLCHRFLGSVFVLEFTQCSCFFEQHRSECHLCTFYCGVGRQQRFFQAVVFSVLSTTY